MHASKVRGRVAMADVERLLMMFRAFRERDETAFYRAAESLISEELAANRHALARELQEALGQQPARKANTLVTNGLSALPKDRRHGERLIAVQERPVDTSRIVLVDETRRQIERVISEHRERLKLARHGLQPKSKLLFWGPPGCGKTLTAHLLAEQLGLSLGLVRLNALISSFLGDTASHVQRVFDTVKASPMVLLLDEIDAVGKNRDDPNDVGELKRVVNGLLQAMDSFHSSESLVIGASNHQYLLDPALWRRFDDIVFFPLPGPEERKAFVSRLLNGVEYEGTLAAITKRMNGLSFADIERVLVEAVKTMILEDRKTVRSSDIADQLLAHESTRRAATTKFQGRKNE